MIGRLVCGLCVVALGVFGAGVARAQDVPGIEICTVEKTMERRTSCLQSNVELLQTLGLELDFAVQAVPDVEWEGQPVSSTRIRDAVRAGDLAAAGQMLGRPYTLTGPVITGQQLGTKLGFPTANLDVAGILTPPAGVYAANARISRQTFRAAVNIGWRPTVASGETQLHVEAHLLDFAGDLRGQELELTFLQKLREEEKFPSLEALRAQIAADIAQVRIMEA